MRAVVGLRFERGIRARGEWQSLSSGPGAVGTACRATATRLRAAGIALLFACGGLVGAVVGEGAEGEHPLASLVQTLEAQEIATPATTDDRGYYQFPTLRGETLVFSSEADLWTVPLAGGTARRLTSHPALESEPHLSPDGRWIAFTGRYEGGTHVFRMPASGGPVERLTFESDEVRVQGWTEDGRILYGTQAVVGPSWSWVLRIVNPGDGSTETLPLADAREGTFDDEGTLYFTRFGLDVTGDQARSYRGGAMAQLWRYRPGAAEAERLLADHEGNLTRPMWTNGALHVVSDAGGVANLWRVSPDGTGAEPLTTHETFEVRGATVDRAAGRIVYQHGADLRVHSVATGEDRLVDIRLGSDRARTRTRWIDDPMNWLNSTALAPEGDRVVVTARGKLVVLGTGELRRIEIPLPEATRARDAILSHDGQWVYAIVDAGGEQEIWRFPASGEGIPGVGQGEPLTSDGAGHRTGMTLAPNGRLLAHTDRRGILYLLDLDTGANEAIDSARGAGYRDIEWSPDSKTLALSRFDTPVRRPQIVLLDLASRTPHVVTSDRYESYSPTFSPDGRWLWFLSDREFTPNPSSPWGDRNLGPMLDQRTRIYAVALQPGNAFPLDPRTELTPSTRAGGAGGAASGGSGSSGGGAATSTPAIVYEGLPTRLFEAPLASGNFSGLVATGQRLYLFERPPGQGVQLRTVDFAPDRARLGTFAEGISFVRFSADRSRILVRRGSDLFIVNAGATLPNDLTEARVRAGTWRIAVEPAEEWQQMFVDAWRMQRDFLFDAEFRGVDWGATLDRYAPLVDRVGDRRELDDILKQLVAEVGILHSQIRTGDVPSDPESASPSFLGGTFEPAPDGLRLVHIYRTDPELPGSRAPLARPGVELEPGDVLLRVNGRPVRSEGELARALAHQAGEPVRLDLLRGGDERSVIAHPVNAGQDALLRYRDWVTSRRDVVEAASEGRVGYLHLRAMGATDLSDFIREFYANFDRDGLIIDVRRNRGGNIDAWIIEKLLKRAWSFWQPPGSDPYWNMQQSFRGHLVVLMDPLTYSDGETFAAGVKTLGLGPVIGKRSAGAGVWLSDTNRLVDQGIMRAAQTPQFDAEGRWIVEGLGVDPDIEVENLPRATFLGGDAQLDRAIRELLDALARAPVGRPNGESIFSFPAPARGVSGGGGGDR
jgi:tricorn protease